MDFAFAVIDTVRAEEPELFDADVAERRHRDDGGCRRSGDGVRRRHTGRRRPGLSLADTRRYLEYVADQRLARLGFPSVSGRPTRSSSWSYKTSQELANFFERTVSAYQVGVSGAVASTRSSEPKRSGPDEATRPPGPALRL